MLKPIWIMGLKQLLCQSFNVNVRWDEFNMSLWLITGAAIFIGDEDVLDNKKPPPTLGSGMKIVKN